MQRVAFFVAILLLFAFSVSAEEESPQMLGNKAVIMPKMPNDVDKLFELLRADRQDLRYSAMLALIASKNVPAGKITQHLLKANTRERLLLYEVASVWGDEQTLGEMLRIYNRDEPHRYESIRLMENILFLGQHYPLPNEFLPYVLRAWLEGDEYFTEEAKRALLNMGTSSIPELNRILYSNDSGRVYSALSLLIDLNEYPSKRVEYIANAALSNCIEALDVSVVCSRDGINLASSILSDESKGWVLQRRAMWWLIAFDQIPKLSLLTRFSEHSRPSLASEARKVIMMFYPQEWKKREEKIRRGDVTINLATANLLTTCSDRESLLTLLFARCDEYAEKYRTKYFKDFLRIDTTNSNQAVRYISAHFSGAESTGSQRFADLANLLARAGQTEKAAKLLSQSLDWYWERQAASALIRIISENPSISSEYYLSAYKKWERIDMGRLTRFHRNFASSLLGDLGEYNSMLGRAGRNESMRNRLSRLLPRFVF